RVRERTSALEAALRDLQQAQSELIRAERVAAVGRLASGIAHELKNPLMSMTFALQNVRDLVTRGDGTSEALEPALATLADDIRRMRDRVQTFLSVARPPEGYARVGRVDEGVRAALERYKNDPRAQAVALRETYRGEPRAHVDEDQLFAAISNLILNALEALEGQAGGRIDVSVEVS